MKDKKNNSAAILYFIKTFKNKKLLNLLFVFSLSLVLGSILASLCLIGSLNATYDYNLKHTYGEQSAILYNVDKIDLKDDIIVRYGYFENTGLVKKDENIRSDITIGKINKEVIELNNISLISGRMPQKEDEIAIESWVLPVLKLSNEIDKSISLTYFVLGEEGDFSIPVTKTYQIVGILENYSKIQGEIESPVTGKEQLPAIIVSDAAQFEQSYFNLSLQVKDKENFIKQVDFVKNQYFPDSRVVLNEYVYGNIYSSYTETVDSYLSYTILILILFIGTLTMLAATFLYLIGNRENLKIMRDLGANKWELFHILFIKSFLSGLLAILPGLLFGLLCFTASGFLFQNIFIIDYIPTIPLAALVSAIFIYLIVYITITCILSLKISGLKEKNIKIYRRDRINTYSVNLLICFKSAIYHSKRIFSIGFSIAVCVFVMVFSFVIYDAFQVDAETTYADYAITDSHRIYIGPLLIPSIDKSGFDRNFIEPFVQDTAVKTSLAVRSIPVNLLVNFQVEEDYQNLPGYLLRPFHKEESSIQEFIQEKEDYGYEINQSLLQNDIIIASEHVIDVLSGFDMIGSFNKENLKIGKEIVYCVNARDYSHEYDELLGQEITFTQIFNADERGKNGERIDFSVICSAIILIPQEHQLYGVAFGNNFLWGEEYFEVLNIDAKYYSLYLDLYDKQVTGSIEDNIANINSDQYQVSVTSRQEVNTAAKKIYNTVSIILGTIILFLGVYAAISIGLNYYYNLREKKELLSKFYCIGMTQKQMNTMIICEYYMYIILSILFFLPVFSFLIYRMYVMELGGDLIASTILKTLFIYTGLCSLGIILYFYNKKWIRQEVNK